ncbi:MAG: transposase, partial [Planctomycetes bacterium]|nr:transposase [Planctomycetota bacterium]
MPSSFGISPGILGIKSKRPASPEYESCRCHCPADLPDDPALLKAMLAEVLAALRASRQEGDRLRERLDQLLRRLYGPRSERHNPDQPLLFAEAAEPGQETTPTPPELGETAKPRR